jgi:hypothetical protein
LQQVQKRAGTILEAIGIRNDFLSTAQMAQQLREKIDKWDYNEIKKLMCKKKKWILNLRGCQQNGRKSLPAMH